MTKYHITQLYKTLNHFTTFKTMSNTARVMSLRASTSFSRPSSGERVIIRCSVAKEVFGHSNFYGEKRVMVNSSESSGFIKRKQGLSMVGPSNVASVLAQEIRAVEVASEYYYLIPRAKHLLMLFLNKDLMKLNNISLKKIQFQMVFEKAIIDCRFFTLFAVAGSLLGSVLCFVEGCFYIVLSYMEYFHTLSHKTDQGHVMQLLIEAIDMFLLGTAIFSFGVGLYSMSVGSKPLKEKGTWLAGSNFFGLFYMKRIPTWVEMHSISHAKSKLGHAVMMILQVGVLEKFKSVPLNTSIDLACFAGTVLVSSACIFLLSKLSLGNAKST